MLKNLAFILLFISFVCTAAEFNDDRKLLLEADGAEMGDLSYGDFLNCLQNASFESEPGPREIITNVKRLVMTTIHNQQWAFQTRENIDSVIIEDITINTKHIYRPNDKQKKLLHILVHCDFNKL